MEFNTVLWMVIMLSAIIGPFVYFANIAAGKEKTKKLE